MHERGEKERERERERERENKMRLTELLSLSRSSSVYSLGTRQKLHARTHAGVKVKSTFEMRDRRGRLDARRRWERKKFDCPEKRERERK